jgi:DNA topoisomerase-1
MDLSGGYKGEPSYDEKHYESGIIRVPDKKGFVYYYVKTNKSVSGSDLKRIHSLGLPPAWTNVWISGDPNTDIQAVGVDSKKRKQYRYHPEYVKRAEKHKFTKMYDFIKALPKLQETIKKHEKLDMYKKKHVIATMLRMIAKLHLRVGKDQYARQNKSYGIASLQKTHLKVLGDTIKLSFKGKSNQHHTYKLKDSSIATHLAALLKLAGPRLFQYMTKEGTIRKVDDLLINTYIQKYMGEQFSVKNFRTYAANYHFLKTLLGEINKDNNNVKQNIINAINISAEKLGHTKAISKKSYVMQFAIDYYIKHPEFFITHKHDNIDKIMLLLVDMYRKS